MLLSPFTKPPASGCKGGTNMKNSNGTGGIVDLGPKRRKRYGVRFTVGYEKNKDGKYTQKYKYVGYYAKKSEAQRALAEFNRNNISVSYINMTFSDVWNRWCKDNMTGNKSSRSYSYTAAYKKCSALYDIPILSLRLDDLQAVLDNYPDASNSTLNNIKIIIKSVYSAALQNDVIAKDYSSYIKIKNVKEVENHKIFKTDEIELMWKDTDKYMLALLYIYTGCRANELIELNKSDVNLQKRYFNIKKSKTKSGIRIVPICDKIYPFFEFYMASKDKTFLPINYRMLRNYFKTNFINHSAHDARCTFVTLMTDAGVPEVITQKIVGHSGGNVTRDVYTQPELHTLLEAVNKI